MLERGPWRDTVPNRSLGLKNLVPLPQGSKAFTHGLRNVGSHRFKKTFTFNKKGFIEAYAGQGINIICSSGVGGGSHVYAGFLDKPLAANYWDNHHPEIGQENMAPYYDQIIRAFNARPLTAADNAPNRIEEANYQGLLTPLGDPPIAMLVPKIPGSPVKITDQNGIERWECDMKNNSFLGSPSGAKPRSISPSSGLQSKTVWWCTRCVKPYRYVNLNRRRTAPCATKCATVTIAAVRQKACRRNTLFWPPAH
ncbi:hypothetical protein [Atlantibacter hermannii]|uniref:hypothetical protein n=1 Tax=Atlantibacter hermannii TaxID=565 RepID=UPI001F528300|nr:hypothetical protein [Atlantibacter hermannii]